LSLRGFSIVAAEHGRKAVIDTTYAVTRDPSMFRLRQRGIYLSLVSVFGLEKAKNRNNIVLPCPPQA